MEKEKIPSNLDPGWETRYGEEYDYELLGKVSSVSDGTYVDFWRDNDWVDVIPVRYEFTDERFSMRIFLIDEKVNLPDHVKNKEKVRKIYERAYARHPDLLNVEAFPYAFVKFNEEFKNPHVNGEKENFRRVFPIRDLNGAFSISPPPLDRREDLSPLIVNWGPGLPQTRFQVSQRVYQAREAVTVEKDFIKDFLTNDANPRLDIYDIMKGLYLDYIDISEEWATLLGLWTMGTHAFRQFYAYAYTNIWSPAGTGKTQILKVTSLLAHNAELILDPTSAASYRMVDATDSVLCIDEADKIDPQKHGEFLGIINSGYEFGHKIPRVNTETFAVEKFASYSPKMLASNRALDPVLASRCLRIPIMRTTKLDLALKNPIADDEVRFRPVKKDAIIWAIDVAPKIARLDYRSIVGKYRERFKDAPPRLLQIMNPILVFYEILGLDDDMGSDSPSEAKALEKVIETLAADKEVATIGPMEQRVLGAAYLAACYEAREITTKRMRKYLYLDSNDKQEAKKYNLQAIGMILDKYNVPHVRWGGYSVWFRRKGAEMTKAEREGFMENLLKSYSMTPDEVRKGQDVEEDMESDDQKGRIEDF